MPTESKPLPERPADATGVSPATGKPELPRVASGRFDHTAANSAPTKAAPARGVPAIESRAEGVPAKPAPAAAAPQPPRAGAGVPLDLGDFLFELSPFDLGPLDFTAAKAAPAPLAAPPAANTAPAVPDEAQPPAPKPPALKPPAPTPHPAHAAEAKPPLAGSAPAVASPRPSKATAGDDGAADPLPAAAGRLRKRFVLDVPPPRLAKAAPSSDEPGGESPPNSVQVTPKWAEFKWAETSWTKAGMTVSQPALAPPAASVPPAPLEPAPSEAGLQADLFDAESAVSGPEKAPAPAAPDATPAEPRPDKAGSRAAQAPVAAPPEATDASPAPRATPPAAGQPVPPPRANTRPRPVVVHADAVGRLSREDALIQRVFAPIATHEGAFGLTDDAAAVAPPPGCELVLTIDTLVAGVHFFADDPPGAIAKKALRVNLSDLAAKAADPLGFVISTALPEGVKPEWLDAFARGLGEDAAAYGFALFGGDTVRTPGPLTITVTAFGTVPAGGMVRRAGAAPGDWVVVTGTIGDATLGLALRRHLGPRGVGRLGARDKAHLADRYLLPQPRTRLAPVLRDHVRAAMDVSDGLAGDLAKMCALSGVGARIETALLPLSPAASAAVDGDPNLLERVVTGGDDYEILMAVAPGELDAFMSAAARVGVPVTAIGEVTAEPGLPVFYGPQGPMKLKQMSFSHF